MSEKKATLPSHRNLDRKKVKVENKKYKRIINTYHNKRHHGIERTNLRRSVKKLGFPERTRKKKIQNLEMKFDRKHRKRNLRERAKTLKLKKNARICWDKKSKAT